MKVGEAYPGQILCAKGRVPKIYTKNLCDAELDLCRKAGFLPGFLMPAWIDDGVSAHEWTGKREHDSEHVSALFYIGPTWLSEAVGGLKKHHLFLYEGNKIALEGYDFRHLDSLELM